MCLVVVVCVVWVRDVKTELAKETGSNSSSSSTDTSFCGPRVCPQDMPQRRHDGGSTPSRSGCTLLTILYGWKGDGV